MFKLSLQNATKRSDKLDFTIGCTAKLLSVITFYKVRHVSLDLGDLLETKLLNRGMKFLKQQAAISQIVFRFRKDVQSEKGWGLMYCA